MQDNPHIIIIGAGLIGLSTADSLLARGARVTMLDRQSAPGLGTSFSNSGMIHPSQSTPWIIDGVTDHLSEAERMNGAAAVLDLASRSASMIRARMRDLRVQDAHRAPGVLQIFDTEACLSRLQTRYADIGVAAIPQSALGLPALFFPDDRSGNAHDYCQALARDIIKRGGNIIYDAGEVELDEAQGRTTSVRFGNDAFQCAEADHIVLAAGPQSRQIGAKAGIDLPIIPVAGYALNFKRPYIDMPAVPVMHHDSHSALTVFEDHVRISGGHDLMGADALLRIWKTIAPRLVKALGEPVAQWTGERPMSRTGKPIIGRTGLPNLWVNTGHGHMGWTLCAASGALIARMILEGAVDKRFAVPGGQTLNDPDA